MKFVLLTRTLSPLRQVRSRGSTASTVAQQCLVEWVAVPAMDSIMQIVARTSNRIFVGLPLCKCPASASIRLPLIYNRCYRQRPRVSGRQYKLHHGRRQDRDRAWADTWPSQGVCPLRMHHRVVLTCAVLQDHHEVHKQRSFAHRPGKRAPRAHYPGEVQADGKVWR